MAYEHRTARVNSGDVTLFYRIFGKAGATPILILHGSIDQEVASHHAAALGEMAKTRKKVPAENTRVVTFDGVNHLLVQTTTGELAEYPTLANKAIDQQIAKTAVEWLGQVLNNVK